MKIDDDIKDAILELTGSEAHVFPAKVIGIDEDEFTCTVRRDDAVDYYDVRLRALVKGELQGFAFIPRMGSMVLVAHIGLAHETYICQYSEIDKVIFTDNDLEMIVDTENIDIHKGDNISLHIDKEIMTIINDNSRIDIKSDVMLFNGGDLRGLVKITELENNLNSLKTFVEAMHRSLPPAFTAVLAALSANGALGAQSYTASMAGKMIRFEDMENRKVKH